MNLKLVVDFVPSDLDSDDGADDDVARAFRQDREDVDLEIGKGDLI